MGRYTLITGRTAKQGIALHIGKTSEDYQKVVAVVYMNERDIQENGLTECGSVEISSNYGSVVVTLAKGNIPEGMVFMPYGPWANLLVSPDTHGVGMPDFKGISVDISCSDKEPWSWKRALEEVTNSED